MPDLTSSPIADLPGFSELEQELQRNISNPERAVSALLGVGLASFALTRRGVSKWGLLAAGGALLYRGITGHCPVYERLSVDPRHGTLGVAGNRGIRAEA